MPVIVSMGPVAASGGYWIATASDKIFAGSQSITGSIGVFGILPNVESLGSTYGLKWDRVKTSPSADIFSVARPKTKDEIGVFQNYVNDTYDRFLKLVAESRGLDLGEVEKMAEGRVWTGLEAYELGLVDQIGGLSQALAEAIKVAGLDSGYEIEEFPKVRTPASAIAELLDVRTDRISLKRETSFNNPVLEKISDVVPLLKSFNDPIGIYGILPWYRAQLGFNPWEMKL